MSGCSPETDQPLASPSTLCRLENRIDRATLGKVHGNQEKRFFHGYYKSYCFLPWYVFRGDPLLCADPRPSNIDAAKHSRAITKLLVAAIRNRWPEVKITLRAASHSAVGDGCDSVISATSHEFWGLPTTKSWSDALLGYSSSPNPWGNGGGPRSRRPKPAGRPPIAKSPPHRDVPGP